MIMLPFRTSDVLHDLIHLRKFRRIHLVFDCPPDSISKHGRLPKLNEQIVAWSTSASYTIYLSPVHACSETARAFSQPSCVL